MHRLALLLGLAAMPLASFSLPARGGERMGNVSPFTAVEFTDVLPTDWAYQALTNLVEQHGCVAGYPDGRFQGQQAISRFEAAALLHACLDRDSRLTDLTHARTKGDAPL